MARILLAEDDALLGQSLLDGLTISGYNVEVAKDGDDAYAFIQSHSFDLLILDWNLPGRSGLEVCRAFRKLGKTEPVLFLTSRVDIDDKSEAFDSGADDYLTKPFHLRELVMRIRALLKRPAKSVSHVAQLAELEIDLDARTLAKGSTVVRLQPRELALLEFFLRRPGQVLGAEALLSGVWGADFEGSEIALRSCLAKLRKALSTFGYGDAIETVHGFGYRFRLN